MIVNTGIEVYTPKRALGKGNDDADKRPYKRRRKRPRYSYDDTVLVLVGVEKTRFTVHTDVICARSEFFKVACKEHWREGQARVVPLPYAESETFQMFMDLMYSRLVNDNELASLPLIEFYVLGDFLGDVMTRNQATMLLLSLEQKYCPSTVSVDFIWENTAPGSLLRKWAVDMIAVKLGPRHFARFITMVTDSLTSPLILTKVSGESRVHKVLYVYAMEMKLPRDRSNVTAAQQLM